MTRPGPGAGAAADLPLPHSSAFLRVPMGMTGSSQIRSDNNRGLIEKIATKVYPPNVASIPFPSKTCYYFKILFLIELHLTHHFFSSVTLFRINLFPDSSPVACPRRSD